MTTPSPRMAAAVAMPTSAPTVSRNAPPAKPSCIGAVVRMTSSIARRRPVGNGPPITETMPALAVMTLLHERATASARWPTRGAERAGAMAGVSRTYDEVPRSRRVVPRAESAGVEHSGGPTRCHFGEARYAVQAGDVRSRRADTYRPRHRRPCDRYPWRQCGARPGRTSRRGPDADRDARANRG